jgi:hypothetical protein
MPWIIAAVVVVLVGVAVLTFFLLRKDDKPTNAASSTTAASSSAAASSSEPMPSMSAGAGALPGGATPTETMGADQGSSTGQFSGSDEVALGWMNGMLARDFQSAYDLTCSDLQALAEQNATADLTPPEVVGAAFFGSALGGQGFTDGTFDSLEYDSANDVDVATFTLVLEDGSSKSVQLWVRSDLTVCNWV